MQVNRKEAIAAGLRSHRAAKNVSQREFAESVGGEPGDGVRLGEPRRHQRRGRVGRRRLLRRQHRRVGGPQGPRAQARGVGK